MTELNFTNPNSKINIEDRRKMILCMEFIMRNLNDEELFYRWILAGIPDDEFKFGEFNPEVVDDYYIDPENFKDFVRIFLDILKSTEEGNAIYCGAVLS